MRIHEPHPWDVTPGEAVAIQRRLRGQVSLADAVDPAAVRVVAGVDNSYVREGEATIGIAAVIVLNMPELEVLETVTAEEVVTFPYVPGLLSFREAPAILAAFRRLATEPDVVLFDGQGYAHPRRLGLASHVGLTLDRPAIGCAKSRLVGSWEEPAQVFGAWNPLVHRGELVGAALRTRPGHAPLFVSPGHKVTVETAVGITLACCRDHHFLPEPTRLAHATVTAARRRRAG